MKIADLKVGQKADIEEATIAEIGEIRTFVRFGRPIRVATATVKDDTGTINMSLWNEDIDRVKEGDKIKLTNGFCKEFQGEKQVTTGKLGKIEVIGEGEAPSAEAETVEEKPEEEAE
ncbi:MAG: DNA-binding protein [Candidatus Pacearchaeota archaeon]|nr:MAG: DNA-binding protein [Candidatus Pacearchaeota archaeon]